MNLFNETRTIPISREQVWSAWKKVRSNGGSYGIDKITINEIDSNPAKYLYPVWNRLASGSYFPPAVREKEIPKDNGKVRKLGIPTVKDRVAQIVIREELEQILEPKFSKNSFAYRWNLYKGLDSTPSLYNLCIKSSRDINISFRNTIGNAK
jgi:retron-type reverse transcriptase